MAKKIDPKDVNFYKGVYYFTKKEAEEIASDLQGAELEKTTRGYRIKTSSGEFLGPEQVRDAENLKLIDFRFDATLDTAEAAAERIAAKMVTNVTEETQQNIRNLIVEAIREGIPPYDAARAIQPLIGLTAQQGQAALKYRATLLESGLSLEKVNEKVDKYADKLLSSRAETISRTEILDALNQGQVDAWEQAQEAGYLSPEATKEWIVTPDDLLCPQCEPYEGKTIPIGDEFPEGDPPLHPRCRCTIGISAP